MDAIEGSSSGRGKEGEICNDGAEFECIKGGCEFCCPILGRRATVAREIEDWRVLLLPRLPTEWTGDVVLDPVDFVDFTDLASKAVINYLWIGIPSGITADELFCLFSAALVGVAYEGMLSILHYIIDLYTHTKLIFKTIQSEN